MFADWILSVAEFTHAHWFFGNLYEAIVKIPDRVAASAASSELPRTPLEREARALLRAGRATQCPAAVAALVAGWKHSDNRAWLMVGAASSATGAAATAYLLRSVNPKLFFGPYPLEETRRRPC
ncbi:hypothetical protein AHiyo8_38710 [Arthrobacter sp. Hiyo8]|nr:hypothetical protein AHiyo8_38710 [Arthrobacter sp. Hiyo8]